MSVLIFSKLFTRRRLQREQEAARPLLERYEGSGLRLARGKLPPQAKCLTDIHANCHWHIDE
ncbi:hypothetical protein [Aeribacillus pallidus]|uniref:hypothetical protein n=1 Tax=Aeribacillus pallidus TaxID=33936 RepID=UPI003D1C44C5